VEVCALGRLMQLPILSLEWWKKWFWIFVRSILLIGLSFIIIYPLLMKISIAFKDRKDIYDPLVVWLPRNFTLDNFKVVFELMDYVPSLINTFGLVSLTTLLQVGSCALTGYAFARLRFKGSGILFAGVILTILVPPQTILLPLYMNFQNFDFFGLLNLFSEGAGIRMLNTYWPFILTAATANSLKSGLYIYIFRQFFLGLPKEIEEASFVDGSGVFKTFYSIMLPNAIPAIVTVLLFSFVWQWNDSVFTGIYMPTADVMSVQLSLLPNEVRLLLGLSGDEFYISMLSDTGVLLTIAPLIIFYLVFQRYFVESVERSGLIG
jgi:multiple sugar transport system permease protein